MLVEPFSQNFGLSESHGHSTAAKDNNDELSSFYGDAGSKTGPSGCRVAGFDADIFFIL